MRDNFTETEILIGMLFGGIAAGLLAHVTNGLRVVFLPALCFYFLGPFAFLIIQLKWYRFGYWLQGIHLAASLLTILICLLILGIRFIITIC